MAEGFHDFTAAEILTAANTDDYLMRQTVMRFASAAARDSALSGVLVEGLVAYLKDIDAFTVYTGAAWVEFGRLGAWTSYTPTWNGTLGNGTLTGKYDRQGRTIHFRISLTYGSTSSSPSTHTFTLPTAPHADYTVNNSVGWASGQDVGVNGYAGVVMMVTGSTIAVGSAPSTASVLWQGSGPFTWATGDQIFLNGTYESAA